MAMMAAMKNVLSPISDSKIMPHDFKKPCEAGRQSVLNASIDYHKI